MSYFESLNLFGITDGWWVYLVVYALFIGVHLTGAGKALKAMFVITANEVASAIGARSVVEHPPAARDRLRGRRDDAGDADGGGRAARALGGRAEGGPRARSVTQALTSPASRAMWQIPSSRSVTTSACCHCPSCGSGTHPASRRWRCISLRA
ncbi:MAG: ethanolamine permease [Pseudonocardiales bacterium]|nr:ethanolamine permease [Pseudonocardiales bacterium]